jgi:hypothetical protein
MYNADTIDVIADLHNHIPTDAFAEPENHLIPNLKLIRI